jgi:hypothetical protein
MSDVIRVNGNLKSWGSLTFHARTERFEGFTSIAWGEKRERTKGYSMARHHAPYGRSAGKYTVENVKLTGYVDTVRDMKKYLASLSADGRSYGNVEFNGVLHYFEPNNEEITVEFDRLTWAANTHSHEESPDPLKVDFELDCMFVSENGLTLFDSSEGMP